MNTKKQLEMTGKTFNECWFVDGLLISENDNIVVNFINDIMVNIFVNGKKQWSVIKSLA